MSGKPPKPDCKTFLFCRQVLQDRYTGEYAILGPTHDAYLPHFPAKLHFAVFAYFSSAQGSYQMQLDLRDLEGTTLCRATMRAPLEAENPLHIATITLNDMAFDIPWHGKYEVVLRANDDDVASDVLWVHLRRPKME